MGEHQMQDGQRVEVRLHGDESWYAGAAIDAGKQWVQLEGYPGGEFIADENSIEQWRPTGDEVSRG